MLSSTSIATTPRRRPTPPTSSAGQALSADARRAGDRAEGLLHLEGTADDRRVKAGSGEFSDHTATAVERLIAAGMISARQDDMVGSRSGAGSQQPLGAPWNPWDLHTHRVAGGFRRGSAVAVASGLAPAAIGSDTRGVDSHSRRLCGLTGLKPTYGLVSLYGAVPLSPTLDSIGRSRAPSRMPRCSPPAIAGRDRRDRHAGRAALSTSRRRSPAGPKTRQCLTDCASRLARDGFPADTLPNVVRAYDTAIATLRGLGAKREETAVPLDFDEVMAKNGRIIAAEALRDPPRVHRGRVSRHRSMGAEARPRRKAISAADYIDDIAARQRAGAAFADWMREARRASLTPSCESPRHRFAEVDEPRRPLATGRARPTTSGVCALSLPAGFSADGLPIGVQLTGERFAEATLVKMGRAFQKVTDWHRRRPPT